MVDALRFLDFINLILGIDAYHEAQKKNPLAGLEV